MSEKVTMKINDVEITSDFWKRYRELVVKEVLPYQWAVMNDTANISIADDPQSSGLDKNSHAVANLKIAAGQQAGHHYGFPFQDTDVYKWLEAAAYSFSYHQDANLKKITDSLVDLIADAQEDDGYLSTYFQIDDPKRKFKRLQQSHELYTMGHYIEAGVAYYQATGSQKALDIAIKMADCIDANLGLTEGKIPGYDGHPEIELALVKLYEVTKEDRYLKLSHYFLTERGQNPDFFDQQNDADGIDNELIDGMRKMPRTYYLAAEPIKDQQTADGHAVRVVYLCTGMAAVAKRTGDRDLLDACHRFWNDIVKRRMYITGNIGSTTTGESFTYDYDLPSDTMYGETCASVGMSFFAKEMLNIEANGEYADILEKELFNGALGGMALDGKHFYYVNALEADPTASKFNPGKHHVLTHRADWFGVACCPANLARLITSVDKYIYAVDEDTILSHQFIANDASFANGIQIQQTNHFPWDGQINYKITNPNRAAFKFGVRIPSWSQDQFKIRVNGDEQAVACENGFVYFDVKDDVQIELSLDMSIKQMKTNNRVQENIGKVSIMRGPIVYAAEEADNAGPLWNYAVLGQRPASEFEENLLNGVVTVTIDAVREATASTEAPLYSLAAEEPHTTQTELKLIPFYARQNREDGEMSVWLHRTK